MQELRKINKDTLVRTITTEQVIRRPELVAALQQLQQQAAKTAEDLAALQAMLTEMDKE